MTDTKHPPATTASSIAPRAVAGSSRRVVQVRGLGMRYGSVEALCGVDLQVDRGEVVALLGPNGAGKTTAVEILAGLRPRSAGEVRVLGVDPHRAGDRWRERIGIVLQSHRDHLRWRVGELLSHIASYYPNPRDPSEVLALAGLTTHTRQAIEHLSGGQRRRLDVALGIIGRPELLFLDEPTTGFDPQARRDFHALIRRLATQDGLSILLSTHDLAEAERLADRIAVLVGGHLAALGTRQELADAASAHAEVVWDDGGVRQRCRTPDPSSVVFALHQRHQRPIPGLEVRRATLEDSYLRLACQQPPACTHRQTAPPAPPVPAGTAVLAADVDLPAASVDTTPAADDHERWPTTPPAHRRGVRMLAVGLRRGQTELGQLLRSPAEQFGYLIGPLLIVAVGAIAGVLQSGDLHAALAQLDPAMLADLPVVDTRALAAGGIALMVIEIGLLLMPQTLAEENHDGTLLRLRCLPGGLGAYLAGKAVWLGGLTLGTVTVLMLVGLQVTGLPVPSTPVGWAALGGVLAMGVLAVVPLGAAIGAVLPPRGPKANGLLGVSVFTLIGMSGVLVPSHLLPAAAEHVAGVFPPYWVAAGVRSALLPETMLPAATLPPGGYPRIFGMLAAWALAGLLLAWLALRRTVGRCRGGRERTHRVRGITRPWRQLRGQHAA